MDTQTPAVLTCAEAAAELRVCRKTLYRMVKNGRVPSLLAGRKILIPRKALDRILSALPTNGNERDTAARL